MDVRFTAFVAFNLVKCTSLAVKLSSQVHKFSGQAVHKFSGLAVHKFSG